MVSWKKLLRFYSSIHEYKYSIIESSIFGCYFVSTMHSSNDCLLMQRRILLMKLFEVIFLRRLIYNQDTFIECEKNDKFVCYYKLNLLKKIRKLLRSCSMIFLKFWRFEIANRRFAYFVLSIDSFFLYISSFLLFIVMLIYFIYSWYPYLCAMLWQWKNSSQALATGKILTRWNISFAWRNAATWKIIIISYHIEPTW